MLLDALCATLPQATLWHLVRQARNQILELFTEERLIRQVLEANVLRHEFKIGVLEGRLASR